MRVVAIGFGMCYNFFALPFSFGVEEEDDGMECYAIHFLCFFAALYFQVAEDEE